MRAFRSWMPSLKVASVWLLRTRSPRGRPPAGDSVMNFTTLRQDNCSSTILGQKHVWDGWSYNLYIVYWWRYCKYWHWQYWYWSQYWPCALRNAHQGIWYVESFIPAVCFMRFSSKKVLQCWRYCRYCKNWQYLVIPGIIFLPSGYDMWVWTTLWSDLKGILGMVIGMLDEVYMRFCEYRRSAGELWAEWKNLVVASVDRASSVNVHHIPCLGNQLVRPSHDLINDSNNHSSLTISKLSDCRNCLTCLVI